MKNISFESGQNIVGCKMEISRLEELKFALSAYNDANRQVNRLWAAASLLSVIYLSAAVSGDEGAVFGVRVVEGYFFESVLIILSGFNIAYCSAHVGAYRVAALYQELVREKFSSDQIISKNFSWFDLAQRAPVSSFNRTYPLFLPIERALGKSLYRYFKNVYDLAFCCFPSLVILLGLLSLSNIGFFSILAFLSGVLSLLSTALLIRWVWRWPTLASD